MSGELELLISMYAWYVQDIIGNEVIAALSFCAVLFMMLSAIRLPKESALAFLIPIAIGLINRAYLDWFGWIIIFIAGLTFGAIAYKFIGDR